LSESSISVYPTSKLGESVNKTSNSKLSVQNSFRVEGGKEIREKEIKKEGIREKKPKKKISNKWNRRKNQWNCKKKTHKRKLKEKEIREKKPNEGWYQMQNTSNTMFPLEYTHV